MSECLLVVDDEPINLEILRELLHDDYEVICAESGLGALAAMQKQKPDLILLDIHMPDMDGYQLIEKIHLLDGSIPVIFVTAFTDTASEKRGLALGAVDYITKPYSPGIVKLRISNQLLMKRYSENLLRTVINSSPSALAFKDLNGIYRSCNTRFAQLVNLPEAEIYGKTAREIFPAELSAKVSQLDQEVLNTRQEKMFEQWHTFAADGHRELLQIIKSPVISPKNDLMGVLTVGFDITAREHAAQEKLRLQDDLFQAQKMENIGRLTGGIAHDFNNMMVGITTYADLGLRNLAAEHKVHKYLQNILDTSHKLTSLIRRLMDFSHKSSVLPVVINLNQETEKALELFKMMLKKNIKLSFVAGEQVPQVFIDPVQFSQVIANLLSNAADAIGENKNGTITITTAKIAVHEGEIKNLSAGDYARLSITDTGSGIAPENLVKIFDPFFTTKPVGKGTGLGLPSVYGIAQQSKGVVTVDSAVNMGTTFSIYLPQAAQVAEKTATKTSTSKGTILVVHGQGDVLQTVMLVLGMAGYTVLVANNAERAEKICTENKAKLDLLILDMTLPEIGAIELTERLLAIRNDLKYIWVSGNVEQIEEIQKDVQHEILRIKPFDEKILVSAVGKILGK